MTGKIQWIALLLLLSFTALTIAMEIDLSGFELNDSEWWVEDIEGRGVLDRSHTSLQFSANGKVSGDTACNRYHGTVTAVGNNIRFGPLAGTRRACAPALMDQEMKFYLAVEKVTSWEVPASGLLHLRAVDGNTVIRAWRVED